MYVSIVTCAESTLSMSWYQEWFEISIWNIHLKHPWFAAEIVISTEKRDYSDENKLRCSSYLIDIISRKLDSNCKWENFTNGTIPNLPNIFNKLYTSYIAWLHEHRLVNNHRIKIITHNWLYNIGSIKAFNQSHEKKG